MHCGRRSLRQRGRVFEPSSKRRKRHPGPGRDRRPEPEDARKSRGRTPWPISPDGGREPAARVLTPLEEAMARRVPAPLALLAPLDATSLATPAAARSQADPQCAPPLVAGGPALARPADPQLLAPSWAAFARTRCRIVLTAQRHRALRRPAQEPPPGHRSPAGPHVRARA